MKKKVLYGVFMALFAFAAIGTLQSCKDDVSDLRTQTNYDLDVLRSKLAELNGNQAYYARIQWVMSLLDPSYSGVLKEDDPRYAELTNKIIAAGGLYPLIDGVLKDLGLSASQVLDPSFNSTSLPADFSESATAWGRLNALKAAMDAIMDGFGLDTDVSTADYIKNLKNKITDLQNDIYGEWKEQDGEQVCISKGLIQKVADIQSAFDSYLDNNVTGILIQGTDNPVFGNFSLPIGVKSNMLFAWYGENEVGKAYTFPTDKAAFAADGVTTIPAGVLGKLNPETVDIADGVIGAGEDGISLGKLYLTLNPTNVDFTDKELTIENSLGETALTIKPVKSDKLLTFGYTRAEEEAAEKAGNGFYECDVVLDPDQAETYEVKIDAGLKSAAKNALKNVSKSTALGLLKAVYDQMSGKLNAYAVRYDWTNLKSDGESTVATAILSQYDLALATAKPLSYNFLADYSASKSLPTFGSIDNFIQELKDNALDKFSISAPAVTINGKEVKFVKVEGHENFEVVSEYSDDEAAYVRIYGLAVDGKLVNNGRPLAAWAPFVDDYYYYYSNFFDYVNEAMMKAVYKAISGKTYNTSSPSFDPALAGDIMAKVSVMTLEQQKQIDEVIKNVEGAVTNMADDLVGKVTSYSDRLQKVVNLYNKVAGKINKFISNPNAYLQAAAFYNTVNGGVNVLSSNPAQPTIFAEAGDAEIILSSFTGEIVAPAYKKYVAITAVDGAAATAADNTKAGEKLNTVLDGNEVSVVANLESGKKYSFVYQAVDFTGRTSTREFYIQVK